MKQSGLGDGDSGQKRGDAGPQDWASMGIAHDIKGDGTYQRRLDACWDACGGVEQSARVCA